MATVRLSQGGLSLRFGDSDTPAPEGLTPLTPAPRIVVAVSPVDARTRVKVVLRSEGREGSFALHATRRTREEQFFEGGFHNLREGRPVEYSVRVEVERSDATIRLDSSETPGGTRTFEVMGAARMRLDVASARELAGASGVGPPTGIIETPGTRPGAPAGGAAVPGDGSGSPAITDGSGVRPGGPGPPAAGPTDRFVEGRVFSAERAGVGGLRVEVVDKNVGTDDVGLASGDTDAHGGYRVQYSMARLRERGKGAPDIQVRVYAGKTFLAASEVRYDAGPSETLDVLLPAAASDALPSEHETLIDAIATHYKGLLRDLKESNERQDITYLANKTGWDARAVALAALADQFSARTVGATGAMAIAPSFFYALFRAGLPANEDTLYHTDAKTLEGVWKKAAEQGVIPKASVDQIPKLLERFETLSAQKLLNGPALVGASSLKQMLAISGLSDPQKQQKFAELYAAHRTDLPAFWNIVTNVFGKDTANRLRVDGKLAFLTVNNAPLMQKVHTAAGPNGLSDPLQLAEMGYHRAEPWSKLLTADVPIPKEIPGDTPESQRAKYAEYLAAQVRLSYPTAALAEMVKSRELPLTGAPQGVPDKVHAFLTEHREFEIGMQPVEQFITQNKLQVASETVKQVKRLQRIYQITPSDQAMIGLMKRGVDAAYHVVRYDRDTFVRSFAADLGGEDHAALTYDKSVRVHNAVLNIALSHLTARTAPVIGVHSPPSVLDPTPVNAGDVIAYATLESLFGSTDFCACDHCRSILSPAAYLVDLLLFLHSDSDVWADFLKTWKQDHANAPYPFVDQNAWQKFQTDWNSQHPGKLLPNTEISPFDVMMSRRPDIQYLPLTCENTNTALPYVDVVNETLEYYISNGLTLHKRQNSSLDEYHGYDTNGVASEDLLASPQFVMDSAYTTLRNERFPAPLPFHQHLENLRRYFNKFEVPLPLAMERLRKTDDLERGTNAYGWLDILMEEIGLSRAEYETLTDSPNAAPLWQMYGFPGGTSDADVIAGLFNAKQFARRIGITYEDLVSILKTRFINPNSDLIPKLERLGVSFATLKALKDGTITDAAFDALLPTGALAPDPAEYGGDIKAWIKNDDNYTRIMSLIMLAIPASTWMASKAYALGDCVLPAAPRAGSTLYYECTTAGTSAATEPAWPTNSSDTVKDGTAVVWTCRDASSCHSFDNFAFRYSDPAKFTQNIGAVEFVRLLRFIRLWKKLGWTIEQTDAAICALYRADLASLDASDINDVTKLDTGFLTLLPRLGIVIRVMKALNLTLKRDLLPLVACWSEIGTHGNTALYRQMFLNPALLKQDAVFADNGYGKFLQYVEVPYTHAQPTLEQAIVNAAAGRIGYNGLTKHLSYSGTMDAATRDALKAVTGVSQQFKDAVVALYSAQRLVTHGEALRSAFNLTGNEYDRIVTALSYDVNTPLTIPNVSTIFRRGWLARKLKLSVRELLLLIQLAGLDPFAAPDPTNPAILRLISLVQALKDRSFKSAVALYLIWNQDLSGKSAPAPAQIAELARTLRGDFASIDDQFTAIEDPNGDVARARMTLVYGQEISDAFFALLDDTLVVDVAYTHTASALEPAITAADPRIAYDDFRHRLSHRGLVTTAMQSGVSGDFQKAVDALFARSEEIKGSFFTAHPELKAPYNIAVAAPPADRHSAFLAAFDPELSRRRKRQQALQRLSAAAGVELVFTQTILDPATGPFPLHAGGDQNKPALDDVLALETPGFRAQFFFRDTATGNVDQSVAATANLDYARGGSNPLPNLGNAISGIWSGQIETPEAGFYNFIVEADGEATVTLKLGGQDRALTQNGNVRRNTDPIELKAGTLYKIELKVEKVKDALSLKWETPKRAREVIPSRYLYPPVILDPFSNAYVRFLKATSLTTGLGLTASELTFFATDSDCYVNGDGWLNVLSASGDPTPDTASALLKPFKALLEFARIKADISASDESLLTVLKDPTAATQNADSLLFAITRWNQISLNEVLGQFGGDIAGLGHFALFRRVYDAFALIQKMGISAKALIQATSNEPTADTVRDLQAALRARYDTASWRDVVRPINDEMRSLQRDALVAYILHQMRSHSASAHIDTADKLFEYFLMDVQMDPCMQTSRIRHALSSVQLFIERCLMNLEPRVSPAAINTKQWAWMKRYRVWEANRKVYLFPENWLEPELRDDPSPFFKETMSELLQSDITEDRAAVALLNYLAKLEEVAKLEPCGIHYIPADQARRTGEVAHVVARTAGAHRKYFYRRYEYGHWTPWEQIKLDIEDNPVIPVVWNDRLFLFWLRILKQGPDTVQKPLSREGDLTSLSTSDIKTDPPQVTVKALLCWSECFNGKWQPTRTSDVAQPLKLDDSAPNAFDRSKLKLSVLFWTKGALRMIVSYKLFGFGASFFLHNAFSTPELREGKKETHFSPRRTQETTTDTLKISYPESNVTNLVLDNAIIDDAVQPNHPVEGNPWDAPFFYEDARHVFYVTTSEQIVPVPQGNGVYVTAPKTTLDIPPLVFEPAKIFPDRVGPILRQPGFGVIDPTPVERYVTEDAYIHRGIGSSGTVRYGDREIGLAGSQIKSMRTR